MDYATLLKLKKNPHYKLSPAQKKKLEEYESGGVSEETPVQFSRPPVQSEQLPKAGKLKRVR